jgi:hypothetical protein
MLLDYLPRKIVRLITSPAINLDPSFHSVCFFFPSRPLPIHFPSFPPNSSSFFSPRPYLLTLAPKFVQNACFFFSSQKEKYITVCVYLLLKNFLFGFPFLLICFHSRISRFPCLSSLHLFELDFCYFWLFLIFPSSSPKVFSNFFYNYLEREWSLDFFHLEVFSSICISSTQLPFQVESHFEVDITDFNLVSIVDLDRVMIMKVILI